MEQGSCTHWEPDCGDCQLNQFAGERRSSLRKEVEKSRSFLHISLMSDSGRRQPVTFFEMHSSRIRVLAVSRSTGSQVTDSGIRGSSKSVCFLHGVDWIQGQYHVIGNVAQNFGCTNCLRCCPFACSSNLKPLVDEAEESRFKYKGSARVLIGSLFQAPGKISDGTCR